MEKEIMFKKMGRRFVKANEKILTVFDAPMEFDAFMWWPKYDPNKTILTKRNIDVKEPVKRQRV